MVTTPSWSTYLSGSIQQILTCPTLQSTHRNSRLSCSTLRNAWKKKKTTLASVCKFRLMEKLWSLLTRALTQAYAATSSSRASLTRFGTRGKTLAIGLAPVNFDETYFMLSRKSH